MQALEGFEDLHVVLRRDADTIIGAGKKPGVALSRRADVDSRSVRSTVVDGIADQILENLCQVSPIDANGWKGIMRD